MLLHQILILFFKIHFPHLIKYFLILSHLNEIYLYNLLTYQQEHLLIPWLHYDYFKN